MMIFLQFAILRATKHYWYMLVKCKQSGDWLIKLRVKARLARLHRQVRFQFSVLWPQPGVCSPSGTTPQCGGSNKWRHQQTWIPKQSSIYHFFKKNNGVQNKYRKIQAKDSWHNRYCVDVKYMYTSVVLTEMQKLTKWNPARPGNKA